MTVTNPSIDFHAIAPEIILSATILLVLFVDLFLRRERKWIAMPVAFVGTALALVATLTLIGTRRSTFGGSYVIDNFAVLFKVLFIAIALVILVLSLRYVRKGPYY